MSDNSLTVDTNILLYLINKDNRVEHLLDKIPVYISYVTEIELLSYHGISSAELKVIEQLIENCTVIEMNEYIKRQTILWRRKYRLKVNDAIVAATSSYLNIPLLTADSDFLKIKELDLRYYEH